MQEYTLKKIIESPSMVARIFRPVLTEEEKNRRQKQIYKAAENLLKSVQINK